LRLAVATWLCVFALHLGCTQKGDDADTVTGPGPLLGTWEQEPDGGLEYTFNEDQTGTSKMAFEPDPIKWTIKSQSKKHYVLEITDKDGTSHPLELDVVDKDHLKANLTEGVGQFGLRRKQ
jgi:hypothetical protein